MCHIFDHSGTQLYFVVNYLLGGLDGCLSATVKVNLKIQIFFVKLYRML